MRIRQVRPEFFSDPVTARLSPVARLTYIGLWCIADDDGWLIWDVPHIGALLSPYESVRVRERHIAQAGEALVGAGRMTVHECGCAHIPTLVDHQRIGGNKTFTVRDQHRVHTSMDKYAVTLGNVKVGNGTSLAHAREDAPPASAEALAALVDEENRAEVAAAIARRQMKAVR